MSQQIAAKNKKLVFAALRSMGNAEAGRILNCSESTVTELTGDKYKFNFSSVCELLARMNLKVVDADKRCVHPRRLEMLVEMAQHYIANMNAGDLWEDDD